MFDNPKLRPEVEGCLSLIRRHEQAMIGVECLRAGKAVRQRRRHASKIQRLARRAVKLMGVLT